MLVLPPPIPPSLGTVYSSPMPYPDLPSHISPPPPAVARGGTPPHPTPPLPPTSYRHPCPGHSSILPVACLTVRWATGEAPPSFQTPDPPPTPRLSVQPCVGLCALRGHSTTAQGMQCCCAFPGFPYSGHTKLLHPSSTHPPPTVGLLIRTPLLPAVHFFFQWGGWFTTPATVASDLPRGGTACQRVGGGTSLHMRSW
eukprot:Sspe_Gene.47013::Locus_23686_Transcript_1_3_Confidence_0.500_Length_2671::g.47013::m.47013